MSAAQAEGRQWKAELNTFLLAYRSTPHSTTGVPPAKAFLQRDIRSKLPDISHEEFPDANMRQRDAREKLKGKQYGDKNARRDDIRVGDTVLIRQPHNNKLTPTYETTPYKVTGRQGSELTVNSRHRTFRRHISHTRRYEEPQEIAADSDAERKSDAEGETREEEDDHTPISEQQDSEQKNSRMDRRERPEREKRLPFIPEGL